LDSGWWVRNVGSAQSKREYEGRLDDIPGIFSLMEPMPGAVDAVRLLSKYFDLYILSTALWNNISAWLDKAAWVQKYFGDGKDSIFYKRLIISHHKNLNRGDYLIDDRTKNGAGEFEGELIRFGSEPYPDWKAVIHHLMSETGETVIECGGKLPGADVRN
jgi:5'(3')-deoxyribonucleotidase